MDESKEHIQSHLFTLRLWDEQVGETETEWRGKVQHVISGETGYFRDWTTLIDVLREMMPELGTIPQDRTAKLAEDYTFKIED